MRGMHIRYFLSGCQVVSHLAQRRLHNTLPNHHLPRETLIGLYAMRHSIIKGSILLVRERKFILEECDTKTSFSGILHSYIGR
jgi:hypothetical protein